MLNCPIPKNLSEVRGFFGLMGYSIKLMMICAQLARPLTNQLKNDYFGY